MKTTYILLFAALAAFTISCKKTEPFTPVCDGSSPTYDADVATLIQQKCSQCHSAGSSNGDYSTFAGISTITSNGKFNQRVLVNQDMPQTGSFSEAQLNTLKCWVENGFPEN